MSTKNQSEFEFIYSERYAQQLLKTLNAQQVMQRVATHMEAVAVKAEDAPKFLTDSQIRVALALMNKLIPDAPKRLEHDVKGTLADLIAASFEHDL